MSGNRKRANRQNASRSTGPATIAGKNVVRYNALKHGLRAQEVVVLGEKAADFEALRSALYETLRPADALQEALVDRVAVSLWRLRRIPSLEAGIFEYLSLANQLRDIDSEIRQEKEKERTKKDFSLTLPDDLIAVPPRLARRRTTIANKMDKGLSRLGKVFCRDLETYDSLGKLSRYESQISRELYRALTQLERLRTIHIAPRSEEPQQD